MVSYDFSKSNLILRVGGQMLILYIIAVIFLFRDEPLEGIAKSLFSTTATSKNSSMKSITPS
jgi:hypothetical protein